MKKFLSLLFIILFIAGQSLAQNCWPGSWNKNLTARPYIYKIVWPTGGWGSMFYGLTYTEDQKKSYISTAVQTAFTDWGIAAHISVSRNDESANPDFTVNFDNIGNGGRYLNQYITFDLGTVFSFEAPCGTYRYWFLTMALHEIGNIFTGTDVHNDSDDLSAMHTVTPNRVLSGISDCDNQAMTALYNTYHSVTVNANFEGDSISVDGRMYKNVPLSGISPFSWREWSFPHTLQAFEMYVWDEAKQNNYWMRFYNWHAPSSGNNYINPFDIHTSDGDGTYTAIFLHECNIIFQNHFTDAGNGGVIKVNGTQYNSPTPSFPVKEIYFNITGGAVDQTINGIYYDFDHWSDNGGTNPVHDFFPTNHHTYTAYFKGTPVNYGKNLHNDINYGQPITLRWTDNPNTNVTKYQIWRNVKGGSGPVLLTTVGRNIQTYVDYDYLLDASYTHDLLWYDVREFYSIDSTYSTPDWLAIYGEIAPKVALTLNNNINSSEIKDYSLTCFPNPFNPSTKINFTIPEDQPLHLIVYDVLGRVVKELLNNYVPKGSYIIIWDGTNNAGAKVNSGIYFYSLQTPDKKIIEKMILTK